MGVLCYEFLVGKPPFETANNADTCKRITNVQLTFPSHMSEGARDLIQKVCFDFKINLHILIQLLRRNPKERLPLKEVLQHAWVSDHVKKMAASSNGNDHQ